MPNEVDLKAEFFAMYDRSLNHGDFGPTLKMCTPDATFVAPGGVVTGTVAIIQLIQTQRGAFEDFVYSIEHIFANDEGVGVVSLTKGRHVRPLFGVPASGRNVEIRMLSIHRLVDGRSVGGWTCSRYVETLQDAYEQARAEGTLPPGSDAAGEPRT